MTTAPELFKSFCRNHFVEREYEIRNPTVVFRLDRHSSRNIKRTMTSLETSVVSGYASTIAQKIHDKRNVCVNETRIL